MGDSTIDNSRFSGLLVDLFREPVTGITCATAVALSVAWWAGFDASSLWMNQPNLSTKPWLLFSSALLHANPLHLCFNVYWTWRFGGALERRFGHVRTAAIFLLLAAGSSAAEYAIGSGGVGLSGVGYGLFGLLWVLGRHDPRLAAAVDQSTVQLFVVWFFLCIVLTVTNVLPIGNVAHASGWGLGALFGKTIAADRSLRRRWVTALTGSFAVIMLAGTVGRPYVNLFGDLEKEFASEGYRALEAKQYERAVELYRNAIERDPNQADWWISLGAAYWYLDRHVEAGEAYERAFRIAPDDPMVRRNRAAHRVRLANDAASAGNMKSAIALYEEAVAIDPEDPVTWHGLGSGLHRAGRYEGAIEAYGKSLSLDPKNSELRASRDELERWLRSHR